MTPTVPRLNPQPDRRSGVALILVLGLIALFLLISFAFTVKTRTDHWMARSSTSAHRVQHIFVQAIDQAMLEGTHYISSSASNAFSSYWYYPRREYINGSDVLPGNGGPATYSDFMVAPMDSYIPTAVRPYVLNDAAMMRWGIIAGTYGESVNDIIRGCPDDCGKSNRITAVNFEPTGISYYLVNCSGYLDVNTPYQWNAASANRHYGTNASEIQIYDLDTENAMTDLRSKLGGHVDSMPEFLAYLQGNPTKGVGVFTNAFFPFSHFVSGEYYSTNNNAVAAAFPLTNSSSAYFTASAAKIKNAFDYAGIADVNVQVAGTTVTIPADTVRGWLLTNLMDYVDVDDIPQSLAQPSQEHVPGFNEVQIKATYSCTKTNANAYSFRLKLELALELWNPHVYRDSTPKYAVRCPRAVAVPPTPGIAFSGVSGCPPGTPSPAGISLELATQYIPAPVSVPSGTFISNTFTVLNFQFTDVISPDPYTQIVYKVVLTNGIILADNSSSLYGGDTVDKVAPHVFTCTNTLPTATTNMLVGSSVTNTIEDQIVVDLEAIDPRFNWSFTNKLCWADARANPSLGTTNNATIAYLTNGVNITDYVEPLDDSDTYMYCQGGPLKTVGDLGYLVFAPWRTIKLYSIDGGVTPYQSVVDTFTMKASGQIEKGLVNPNTAHQKVLAAVFKGLPMDRFPDDAVSTTNKLSWTNSLNIAEQIIRYTYNVPPGTDVNPYAITSNLGVRRGLLNISDTFAYIGDNAFLNGIGADSEFTREALVRNSAGLLNTRQILYTAFLAASDELDAGGRGENFNIRDSSRSGAEKRAVAVIWSDPWKNQREPDFPDQFIRFFRLMPSDSALAGY